MREPHPLHTTTQHTGPTQAENLDHTSDTCDPIDLKIEVTTSQPSTTTPNLGKTITPPHASDVIMQKNIDPTPNSPSLNTRMRHKPPFRRNAKSNKHLELQKTKRIASSGPSAPMHAIDPDKPHRKRRRLPTPRLLGT